jgi:uncharacterized surface protein with fasciclin (FAS1) repeats
MRLKAAALRGLAMVAGLAAVAALPTGAAAQQRNCIDTLAGMPNYARMIGAVTHSHMVNELRNAQNITIFAPTNQAIEQVSPVLVDRLFPREGSGGGRLADPVLAAAAIQAHIVQGRMPAASLSQGVRVSTLAGTPLTFSGPGSAGEPGGSVTAAEGVTARIVQGDIPCSNGVIHGIDRVLIR